MNVAQCLRGLRFPAAERKHIRNILYKIMPPEWKNGDWICWDDYDSSSKMVIEAAFKSMTENGFYTGISIPETIYLMSFKRASPTIGDTYNEEVRPEGRFTIFYTDEFPGKPEHFLGCSTGEFDTWTR